MKLYEEILLVYKVAFVQLIYLTEVVIAHWSEGLIIKVWMYPGSVSLGPSADQNISQIL